MNFSTPDGYRKCKKSDIVPGDKYILTDGRGVCEVVKPVFKNNGNLKRVLVKFLDGKTIEMGISSLLEKTSTDLTLHTPQPSCRRFDDDKDEFLWTGENFFKIVSKGQILDVAIRI